MGWSRDSLVQGKYRFWTQQAWFELWPQTGYLCDFELSDLGQAISQGVLRKRTSKIYILSRKVLRLAVCKLEVQEGGWCNSAQVWRSENHGSLWCKSVWGQEKIDVPAQVVRQKRSNSPFLCLFVRFRPSKDWRMPTHTGDGSLLHSTYSNADLIQKHLHGHTQISCSGRYIEVPCEPVWPTHKKNHHRQLPKLSYLQFPYL